MERAYLPGKGKSGGFCLPAQSEQGVHARFKRGVVFSQPRTAARPIVPRKRLFPNPQRARVAKPGPVFIRRGPIAQTIDGRPRPDWRRKRKPSLCAKSRLWSRLARPVKGLRTAAAADRHAACLGAGGNPSGPAAVFIQAYSSIAGPARAPLRERFGLSVFPRLPPPRSPQ